MGDERTHRRAQYRDEVAPSHPVPRAWWREPIARAVARE
jgi:hypothetical protein